MNGLLGGAQGVFAPPGVTNRDRIKNRFLTVAAQTEDGRSSRERRDVSGRERAG